LNAIAIRPSLSPLRHVVRLAGGERVTEDAEDLISVGRRPDVADHFFKIAADRVVGKVAETGLSHGVHLLNAQIGIDEIDTDRGVVKQRFKLLAASSQLPLALRERELTLVAKVACTI